MKLAIFITATLFSSLVLATGPGEGGGGNAQLSTRADLDEIVSSMDRHVWEISDSYLFGHALEITTSPLNEDLSKMTKAILGSPNFTITNSIKEYLKNVKLEVVEGPCFDGQEPRDASTKYQKNSAVCLSASRLARFPKSTLKQVLIPLLFHEVAHQFGYEEKEAQAFQDLAALYLKYRRVYVTAVRARIECALASDTLTQTQKQNTLADIAKLFLQSYDRFPSIIGTNKVNALMSCVAWSTSTGENLERIYDGNIWAPLGITTLTAREKSVMMNYVGQKQISFLTMIETLTKPATDTTCVSCKSDKSDRAQIMMLGGQAALEHIDHEVGRLQNLIHF